MPLTAIVDIARGVVGVRRPCADQPKKDLGRSAGLPNGR
jgi:hypothetical protein